jgi:hypothetical protein
MLPKDLKTRCVPLQKPYERSWVHPASVDRKTSDIWSRKFAKHFGDIGFTIVGLVLMLRVDIELEGLEKRSSRKEGNESIYGVLVPLESYPRGPERK